MSQEFTVGQRFGDYEILAILGAGGMGKVYKVRNVISDRIEAMKVLLSNLTGQKELADRFLREIKLLASLNHPNIATLRTALSFENQLVMIMEYVEGGTLASRLQKGPIPAPDAVNYIDQILAALGYAHRQNIVHRDVKPANMMLTPKGVVKLMDFGIARSASDRGLTMTGTTLGSLNYMPPEQVKGEAADARSDLYSLGVSLYEIVCGRLPFQGDSSYSLMAAHLNEVPKPPSTYRPDLPAGLDQITLLALSKDPKQRFQSAEAFRAALKSIVFPVAKTMPGPPAYAPQPGGASATALFQEKAAPGTDDQLFASAPPVLQQAVAPSSSIRESGHRGLYIALGALLALVVLFAAGLYLPRRTSTRADGDKGGAAASPAHSSVSASAAGPATSSASAMSSASTPAGADGGITPRPIRRPGRICVPTLPRRTPLPRKARVNGLLRAMLPPVRSREVPRTISRNRTRPKIRPRQATKHNLPIPRSWRNWESRRISSAVAPPQLLKVSTPYERGRLRRG